MSAGCSAMMPRFCQVSKLTAARCSQALRRSIKGDKEKQPINIGPKSAVAIVPPKKVGAEIPLTPLTISRRHYNPAEALSATRLICAETAR